MGEEEPRLNAWIGPGGTVSPLHFDPDHNILVQVGKINLFTPSFLAPISN